MINYKKHIITTSLTVNEALSKLYSVAIGLTLVVVYQDELENELKLKFLKFNYQITFHPETLSDVTTKEQFGILLDAIEQDKESFFVFTKANADTDGRIINKMIDSFVKDHPQNAKAFSTLGSLRFLSVLKLSDGIIGNSSSGIVEAPSLGIPTINIGNRQKGRIQVKSVIDVEVNSNKISEALQQTKNESFIGSLSEIENPYGDGNTTAKIMKVLSQTDFSLLKTKKFYDLN